MAKAKKRRRKRANPSVRHYSAHRKAHRRRRSNPSGGGAMFQTAISGVLAAGGAVANNLISKAIAGLMTKPDANTINIIQAVSAGAGLFLLPKLVPKQYAEPFALGMCAQVGLRIADKFFDIKGYDNGPSLEVQKIIDEIDAKSRVSGYIEDNTIVGEIVEDIKGDDDDLDGYDDDGDDD